MTYQYGKHADVVMMSSVRKKPTKASKTDLGTYSNKFIQDNLHTVYVLNKTIESNCLATIVTKNFSDQILLLSFAVLQRSCNFLHFDIFPGHF